MPLVAFRVDSSHEIGAGHLARCINLAEALKNRGIDVIFACRKLPGLNVEPLKNRGIGVVFICDPHTNISEVEDACNFISALDKKIPDWIVLDHYSLGITWESRVKLWTARLAVIEDLSNRQHSCDLLINTNLAASNILDYLEEKDPPTAILRGPKFALLSPRISSYRRRTTSTQTHQRKIYLFGGGSDQKNLVGKVVDALCKADVELKIDVVLGANSAPPQMEPSQSQSRTIRYFQMGSDFFKLMAGADLAIGAGGTSTWERLCIGVPSIVISVAENQVSSCRDLSKLGLIHYLGAIEEVDQVAIVNSVQQLLGFDDNARCMVQKGMALVDGLGALRVVEKMFPASHEDIAIRRAESNDSDLYYSWVCDPLVRENSINQDPISLETHKKWFDERINSLNTTMYVFTVHSLPIGQVRIDSIGTEGFVSFSLDSIVRGRKWATHCLRLAVDDYQTRFKIPINAVIRTSNVASIAAFTKVGFKEQAEQKNSASDLITLTYVPMVKSQ